MNFFNQIFLHFSNIKLKSPSLKFFILSFAIIIFFIIKKIAFGIILLAVFLGYRSHKYNQNLNLRLNNLQQRFLFNNSSNDFNKDLNWDTNLKISLEATGPMYRYNFFRVKGFEQKEPNFYINNSFNNDNLLSLKNDSSFLKNQFFYEASNLKEAMFLNNLLNDLFSYNDVFINQKLLDIFIIPKTQSKNEFLVFFFEKSSSVELSNLVSSLEVLEKKFSKSFNYSNILQDFFDKKELFFNLAVKKTYFLNQLFSLDQSFYIVFLIFLFGLTLIFFLFFHILTYKLTDNNSTENIYFFESLFLIIAASFFLSFLAFFNNIFWLILGVGGSNIAIYVLVGLNNSSLGNEGAIKKYVYSSTFFCFFLLSIVLMYISSPHGSLELFDILNVNLGELGSFEKYIYNTGVILFISSLCFFMGAAPFSKWVADTYESSLSYITVFLMTYPKFCYLFLLYKIIILSSTQNQIIISYILLGIGIMSLLTGLFGALLQKRIKRLLAYSSIFHLGILLLFLYKPYITYLQLGKVMDYQIQFNSFRFFFSYIILYVCSTFVIFFLFLFLGILKYNIIYITDLRGLSFAEPFAAFSLSLFFFSYTGIPPLIGFFQKFFFLKHFFSSTFFSKASKFYIFYGFFDFFLLIIIFFCICVSSYYYIRVVKSMFFEQQALESYPRYYINKEYKNKILLKYGLVEKNSVIAIFKNLQQLKNFCLSFFKKFQKIQDFRYIKRSLELKNISLNLAYNLFLIFSCLFFFISFFLLPFLMDFIDSFLFYSFSTLFKESNFYLNSLDVRANSELDVFCLHTFLKEISFTCDKLKYINETYSEYNFFFKEFYYILNSYNDKHILILPKEIINSNVFKK